MDAFVFQNPTKIIFGKNTVSKIGKEVSFYGKKALFVYGMGSIKKNGVYDKIIESFNKNNIVFVEHSGVKPNPVLSHVKDGIEKFKKEKCDVIVACGGGSVIDESKAIAAGVKYDGDVWDFFVGKAKILDAIPLCCVLTLPATGSEANSGCVVTNEKTFQKYSAHSRFLFPKVSILDPSTTISLPTQQISYGCVDAMLHVLEGYFTTTDKDCIVTDNYVYAIVRSLMQSSRRILLDPSDYNARASMMWSCTLALNGMEDLGYKNVEFVNHVIEHSLSAFYDIPHGLGLAIVFIAFLKRLYNKKIYDRLANFGKEIFNIHSKIDEDIAKKTILSIEEFFRNELNLKTKLSENRIPKSDFKKIALNAMDLGRLWGWSYSEDDVIEILQLAL